MTTRDYASIAARLDSRGTRDERLRRVADALWDGLHASGVSWVGFYLDTPGEPDDVRLVLGPHRDKPACSPIGLHGACGQALVSGCAFVVRDVADLGAAYIACDPRDRSEIVIPLVDQTSVVWGVLDLDSHELGAFDDDDAVGLVSVLRAGGLLPLYTIEHAVNLCREHLTSGSPDRAGQLLFDLAIGSALESDTAKPSRELLEVVLAILRDREMVSNPAIGGVLGSPLDMFRIDDARTALRAMGSVAATVDAPEELLWTTTAQIRLLLRGEEAVRELALLDESLLRGAGAEDRRAWVLEELAMEARACEESVKEIAAQRLGACASEGTPFLREVAAQLLSRLRGD